uniref:Methenyltetrahydrofolate synthase domain-containing protein n=1 Tax=Timspurckia oligopyrenoides TaxID=708627 RepID=A0A7S1ET43_9RHOD|mmetsp:Transcript_6573/g.11748  ORF Transcript_6573/g.11748 Transcript_6573/m.11748 type:complete len:391 (+) Transcript_6573:38-1210(+)
MIGFVFGGFSCGSTGNVLNFRLKSEFQSSLKCNTHRFRIPMKTQKCQKLVRNLTSNDGESEEERLLRDKEAMEFMKRKSEFELEQLSSSKSSKDAADARYKPNSASAWKWEIRYKVWDLLMELKLARNPMPVHHRIPNFEGAEIAANRLLTEVEEFQSARCIKVNPDSPQRAVRYNVLNESKLLLCPQPRLRTGFFSELSKEWIPSQELLSACSAKGFGKYGKPLSLNEMRDLDENGKNNRLIVDCIVVGSVAVASNGSRIGKGEGFAELEYGILRLLGSIDENTPVITVVHDVQVMDDALMPLERMGEHDVPVDIIVTPTRVIRVNESAKKKKPNGVLWNLLSPQKLAQIRVLQQLKKSIEDEQGIMLPSGPEETLPPTATRGAKPKRQ